MAGEHVGGACSVLNTGAQVGGFFAPILTPMIASRAGWRWALYVGCLVSMPMASIKALQADGYGTLVSAGRDEAAMQAAVNTNIEHVFNRLRQS